MNRFQFILHDLRSPLARAKTLAKLLAEASPEERENYVRDLLESLEELDQRLSKAHEEAIQ